VIALKHCSQIQLCRYATGKGVFDGNVQVNRQAQRTNAG
jgi:hypothetical protein